MANKKREHDEQRIKTEPLESGKAVPGTGHDTKKIKQKGT